MTLLMFNGFEGYTDPVDQRDAGDGITAFEASDDMEYTTGRNGGNGLKNVSPVWNRIVYMKCPPITNDKFSIGGCAVYFNHYADANNLIWFGNNGGIDGIFVQTQIGGNMYIGVKSFGIKADMYYPFSLNQWYYIEFKLRLHSSVGYGSIRINEQEVLEYPIGNLVWTGSTVNRFTIGALKSSQSFIDDVYVADNQGTENNDFLGDIRVDAIRPNGAGNHTDFTPSAGANYECVDEIAMDDADYVEGANAGEKDSYTYGSVPTDLDDSGIIALQIKNNAKRTATADNIKIDNFIRTGSTDYNQIVLNLSDEFTMVDGDIILDDPSDSNPWTQAKINACEFGVEVA